LLFRDPASQIKANAQRESDSLPRDAKGNLLIPFQFLLFILLVILFAAVDICLIVFCQPSHLVSALIYAAVLTSPVSWVLLSFTRPFCKRVKKISVAIQNSNSSEFFWNARGFFFWEKTAPVYTVWTIICITLIVGLFLMANVVWDDRAAVDQDFVIYAKEKSLFPSRGGPYYVRRAIIILPEPILDWPLKIEPIFDWPVAFIKNIFSNPDGVAAPEFAAMQKLYAERVWISESEYSEIVPGTTHMTLKMHKGFFNLIWYNDWENIVPPRPIIAPPVGRAGGEDELDVRSDKLKKSMELTYANASTDDQWILASIEETLDALRIENENGSLPSVKYAYLLKLLSDYGAPQKMISPQNLMKWQRQVEASITPKSGK
jgi:hypothetical protein